MPSNLDNMPVEDSKKKFVPKHKTMIPAKILNGISILYELFCEVIGYMIAVTPKIINVLMVLLPKILVKAISLLPFMAAIIFTTNSGADVPKATMVNPITKSGMLRRLANPEAPSTNQLADAISSTKPTIKRKDDKSISLMIISKFV